MDAITTERLALRPFTPDDAPFVLELLNDPAFIRFLGDKNVRTLDAACAYMDVKLLASYDKNGFGLLRVSLRSDDEPIGMCGLVKRESLTDVDLGFAFLSPYCGKGYAYEAARATLDHARDVLGLNRVVAITAPDNVRSMHLLGKLGLHRDKTVDLGGDLGECVLYTP